MLQESQNKQENIIAILHTVKKMFQLKRKQNFLISGRKYRTAQTQVIKFFIDDDIPNLALNLAP